MGTIKITKPANGSIGLFKLDFKPGEEVVVNILPDKGYWMTPNSLTLDGAAVKPVFKMPEEEKEYVLTCAFEQITSTGDGSLVGGFADIIRYYGEENILGLGFDNSAAIMFGNHEFSLDKYYIPELNCIELIDVDSKGNAYKTIKHVETIQSIIVRHPSVQNFETYDRISLRG